MDTRIARGLPWMLAALTVAVQIPYPLVHGTSRDGLTIASVLAFCAASVTHAAWSRGPRWASGLFVAAAGTGLVAEAVGVRTGVPFGRYAYASSLGPKIAGVPAVIPLAWTMMAYPALLAGRRVAAGPGRPAGRAGAGRGVTALVGGLVLVTWDLFLDPQMVDAGHWRWHAGGPALNGIPLSNAAGWLAVGVALVALLDALPGEWAGGRAAARDRDDRLPFALLAWTYASSLLANLVFFDRPAVGLTGGLAMGAVLAAVLLGDRSRARTTAAVPASR